LEKEAEYMRRLYYHPGAYFDGKNNTCSRCGLRLGNCLMSETPCEVQTTYYTEIEALPGYLLFIDVYNLVPHLRAAIVNEDSVECYDLKLEIDDDSKEELYRAMLNAVSEQGSISISGHYGLTQPLACMISELAGKSKNICVLRL
jgi:hypothetical protein